MYRPIYSVSVVVLRGGAAADDTAAAGMLVRRHSSESVQLCGVPFVDFVANHRQLSTDLRMH